MKLAVIGAGVAGLTAAYLLQRRHDVTLFEKNDYLGGHTNTITVPDGPDAGTPVDTGFIVFNDRNYPTFIHLLAELGITGRLSDMSFGFSSRLLDLEYSSYVPGGLFAQKRNLLRPSFYSMVADILRFNKSAAADLHAGRLADVTLGEYLRAGKYSAPFRDFYLIPMGAAIWSTPQSEMLAFPARTFLRFFDNHGLLALKGRPQWRSVPGGSHAYVKEMMKRFKGAVQKKAGIGKIKRSADHVLIRKENGDEHSFDAVVIAAHADEALKMLEDPSHDEKRLLGAWTYTRNATVLHTDDSVMPRRKKAWASWNYTVEGAGDKAGPVTLSYHMNRLQGLATQNQYFVTLNRQKPFPRERVIKEISYTHPSYTLSSLRTQAELPKLNGARRTYFCGSYFGYGFHEDAVKAAVQAAKTLGVEFGS